MANKSTHKEGQSSNLHFIISCEHASNAIPEEWAYLFRDGNEVLKSHRGWDPGALPLAKKLAKLLNVQEVVYPFGRLLIEPNRSLHHPKLFSEFTKNLSPSAKQKLIDEFWTPHRNEILKRINSIRGEKSALHIGVHTFTPVFDGQVREVDIGLLYDPGREMEKSFCNALRKSLNAQFPDLKIRMNQPYKGSADGLTTSLRKQFTPEEYMGIELEVNQKFSKLPESDYAVFCEKISHCIADTAIGRRE